MNEGDDAMNLRGKGQLFGISVIVLGAMTASGCTTTQEVNAGAQQMWIGQSSDAFFARFGAPYSSFALNDGGTNYSWRGGVTTITIPAEYRDVPQQNNQPVWQTRDQRTTTTVTNPEPGRTITDTRTTTSGITIRQPPLPGQNASGQVLVRPAQERRLACEATITTNAGGTITAFNITRDTDGAGFAISRCSEVLGITS